MDEIVGKAADAEGIPASKGSAGGETPVLDKVLGKDVMDGLRGGQAEKGGTEIKSLNRTPIKAGTEAESGALIDVDTNKNMINPPESLNQQAGTNLAGKDPAAEIMGYLEAEEGRGTESEPSLEAMIEEASKNERGMSAAEEDAAAGKIMEEMTGEKAKDIGGTILEYKPTSGFELKSTPEKTTTVLGRYGKDTRNIIKELDIPKSTDFNGNIGGFNLLNTPDECYTTAEKFWNEYNKPFIDAAIARGDEIVMSTPLTYDNLYLPGSTELTGYGREYYYLRKCGYEYMDGKMILKK